MKKKVIKAVFMSWILVLSLGVTTGCGSIVEWVEELSEKEDEDEDKEDKEEKKKEREARREKREEEKKKTREKNREDKETTVESDFEKNQDPEEVGNHQEFENQEKYEEAEENSYDAVYEKNTYSVDEGTKMVGSDVTGYVEVPYDFVEYTDIADLGENAVQYSDISGQNVVTLYCFEANGLDAKTYANNLYNQFENDSMMDSESIEAATVTIDNYKAYQVYGYYPEEEIFLVTWVFDGLEDDDFIQFVSVEFTADNVSLFEMVESSYWLF